ncbi:hypothetical protein [Sorangium sp. So ce1335]|uniref:hypothetical protein n=1 Tax=Sorangium sp. So ce1335 TaxID=3133335 RepID=UPI003F5DDD01
MGDESGGVGDESGGVGGEWAEARNDVEGAGDGGGEPGAAWGEAGNRAGEVAQRAAKQPRRTDGQPGIVVLGLPAPPSAPTSEQALALRMAARERGITTLVKGPIASASRSCPGCGHPVPDFRKSCYVCSFELGRT